MSSSSSPLLYCLSNYTFSPTYDDTILLICLVLSKTANPHVFLPYLSWYPQLLDTQVRSLTPDSLTALIKFIGTPQRPKPPTKSVWLSLMPSRAFLGHETILEKRYACLAMLPKNILLINIKNITLYDFIKSVD